ncbi:UNVERIFIED_CONTAM: hypothetical protein Slati_1455500 [Sesamum latifolium]|uniref:Reverse transcriptase Ty1/copia-type domain-containing protein n=1 Tax=Sesamum latifolium TaxID=2727402 RepID=A0AAW2X9X5_9LAMI
MRYGGKPASYKYLRVWGTPAYVKRLVGDKLDSRSSLCRFIGYPKETAGYYFYDLAEQKIFVSRNAVFLEKGFPSGNRRDEVLIEKSSGEPHHDSTTSFEPKGGHGLQGQARGERIYSTPRVDFEVTYSPVAMAKFIRILLAIAAWYDYEIWQMDVKMAFLNGFVEEEIFMDQPEGFTAVGEEQKVCRLQRSIYGLKQASRSWNTHFDEVIRGYDFIKNDYDSCIYKKISGSSVAYLVLYVDDILLIGNDFKMLGDIKAWFTQFSMKDMGETSYILGIKIYRDRSRRMLGLTQSSYIEKTPKIDEELKRMSNIPYASAVGSIQYVVQCTRPDVAYALSVMSRYQACARKAQWGTVKSILKYLKRTKDMFLIYGGGELILEGYSNASFQSDDDDAKFQLDFLFKLNSGVVAWKSYKQDTTADSTTEAE